MFSAVVEELPETVAREETCLPVHRDGETLHIASCTSDNVMLRDKLRFILNRNIVLHARARQEILEAINHHYGSIVGESCDSILQEFCCTAIDFTETVEDDSGLCDGEYYPPEVTQESIGAIYSPVRKKVNPRSGHDRSAFSSKSSNSGESMFFYTIEEGQKALAYRIGGKIDVLDGPARVWKGFTRFVPMKHFVAHPGEFLTIRFHDGTQENLRGPAQLWLDPRIHQHVECQEGLTLAAREAVVVYGEGDSGETKRRICHGPSVFVPEPGEWLHRFTWHASEGGSRGVEKRPGGLQFHKMWLMPDQMYHDVRDVRTADDAVLVVRLMIFFELLDIETMLDTTHDPIGDFINAATSDVVEFTGKLTFEDFKKKTDQLNELSTYSQLLHRAQQCGYQINNVVYRGYGAPDSLQKMHDEAIAARTRLQLERLECQVDRSQRRRKEQSTEVEHDLQMKKKREQAELTHKQEQQELARQQKQLDAELVRSMQKSSDLAMQEHLAQLSEMGVELTEFLTQGRADQVVELRGSHSRAAQFHLGQPGNGRVAKRESQSTQ